MSRGTLRRHGSTQSLLGKTMRMLRGDASIGKWFGMDGWGSLGPQLPRILCPPLGALHPGCPKGGSLTH